jgi:hypothetical protein
VDIVDDDYELAIRISAQPSDQFTIWRKIHALARILVATRKPFRRYAASGESQLKFCSSVG